MTLPEKMLLRRGEVKKYLGISSPMVRKMIACGILHPVHLNKGPAGQAAGYAYFKRAEVLKIANGEQDGARSQT